MCIKIKQIAACLPLVGAYAFLNMALAARGLQLYLCGAISALYAVGQIPKAGK